MELLLSTRPGRRCTVLQVRGDLDMENAPLLRDSLQSLIGPGQLVVDLAGVAFIDSSALGALVVVFKAMRDAGGRLCLAGLQQPVRTVLQVTSVDRVIDAYDTVEAAEESMPPDDVAATE